MNSYEALTEKQASIESFKSFLNGIPGIPYHQYEYSENHDGFSVVNPHSNGFTYNEIKVVLEFCEIQGGYSFSFTARKTSNQSGYKGVALNIQI